jgi:WhiB family redox-sensing transcriptional regulator
MRYITTNDATPPALRGIGDHSWHARGRCYGMAPKDAERLFFAGRRAHAAIAQAKRLCASCPVRKDCFTFAIDNELRHGIWGGLTDRERRPWHAEAARRLDYARIHAALNGRDVALSMPERNTLIRHACLRGWSAERVAYLLKSDLEWVKDELREAAYDIADRDRYWDLYTQEPKEESEAYQDDTAPRAKEPTAQAKAAPAVPVTRQVHTTAVIDALRRAV